MLIAALTGLFGRSEKATAEELALLAQKGNDEALTNLLSAYTPFMKKTAAQVCKRFIDDHDDEYSIALSAFHEAIEGFELGKNASFLTFAHMVIRRRMIDFIRKENRRSEFSSNFTISASSEEETLKWIEDSAALNRFSLEQQSQIRREEIAQYEVMLSEFNLSYQILVKVSPSHEDARKSAVQIAQLVAETEEYMEYLRSKKKLPIKEIEKMVRVSRKTIERNRKYIIAIILLLNSDLHYLKDYLKERLL
ncbi:RNA polymerase sigma-I factor [Planococcus shenhongbingii]|uniref:RNA polymerase sigma factor SigI n=1 Tax=Planococcus shenhongbingii TaxID=3058398 RepID=A0ABT8N8Z1_9BACL|nr:MULTISPECIES: RNA polymerase sigma-I factor [unclassified Planococcus (in: firmicutes)]MDN7244359.1 RNA polymerase sigma-I factor [Planococcus sp. N017]WKA57526.1 RNA polymerase sigma-I factor [Planococcus sp. N016]